MIVSQVQGMPKLVVVGHGPAAEREIAYDTWMACPDGTQHVDGVVPQASNANDCVVLRVDAFPLGGGMSLKGGYDAKEVYAEAQLVATMQLKREIRLLREDLAKARK